MEETKTFKEQLLKDHRKDPAHFPLLRSLTSSLSLVKLWVNLLLIASINMMPQIIGLKQLRENVAEYAKKVQKGRSFIVVKQSKPLFKISPIDEVDEYEDGKGYKTLIDFTKIKKSGVDAKEILKAFAELRDEEAQKVTKKTSAKR